MAIRSKKNVSAAIKKRRSKTIVGSLFRGAGTIFNASAYTWIGNKLDKLILGDQDQEKRLQQQEQINQQQEETEKQTGYLRKDISKVERDVDNMNKLHKSLLDIIKQFSKDLAFIKERVSVTFFQVKDLSGEIKDVMYDPLGPAGGQFRRATEGGTLTADLPKELETKVISKVASFALKQNREQIEPKLEKIEYTLEKITTNTDPTKFQDPTEDLTAVDPLERLRREMNEGFEKIMKMLENISDGKKDGLDLSDWAVLAQMGRWFAKSGLLRLGLAGLAAGIAGLVSYEVGKYINEKLGVSDKILDGIEWIKDKLGWLGFETDVEEQRRLEGTSKDALLAASNELLAKSGSKYKRTDFDAYQDEQGNTFKLRDLPPDEQLKVKNAVSGTMRYFNRLKKHIEENPQDFGLTDPTSDEINRIIIETFADMDDANLTEQAEKMTARERRGETEERQKEILENAKRELRNQRREKLEYVQDKIAEEEMQKRTKVFTRNDARDALNSAGTKLDKNLVEKFIKGDGVKGYAEFITDLGERAAAGEDVPTTKEQLADAWKGYILDQFTPQKTSEQLRDDKYEREVQQRLREGDLERERRETGGLTFEELQGAIGGAESSTGDPNSYDARLLINDKVVTGDKVDPVKVMGKELENMTIDEVLEYQDKTRINRDTTRAVGKYGFMRSTLKQQIETWNKNNPNDKIDPKKELFDEELQDKLANQLTRTNIESLKAKNIDVSPGTIYAAHHLGMKGLQDLLKAEEEGKGEEYVSTLYSEKQNDANPHFRTIKIKDFISWADAKMMDHAGSIPEPTQDTSDDLSKPREGDSRPDDAVLDLINQGKMMLEGIKFDEDGSNLQPVEGVPPPPLGNIETPAGSDSAGGQKTALNYIDGRQFNLIDNGGNAQQDNGIDDSRNDDTSFGRNRMRDSNLPWSMA